MLSGQTRAVLERTVATQKLQSCPREKRQAKDRLLQLYNEAKAEYDRLKLEVEIENAAEDFGVYLG